MPRVAPWRAHPGYAAHVMIVESHRRDPPESVPVYGLIVEKDVDVPMRDGARLKADVMRPDAAGTFPAILNLGPYQKDKLWIAPDNLEEKPNPVMNWDTRT